MSKKTATKTTKKPNPKAAGERALNLRKIAMEEEELRIRRIVSKMLEPVHERLTALESRSAPAETWVPKVGEYMFVRRHPEPEFKNTVQVCDGRGDHPGSFMIKGTIYFALHQNIRPATPAEIADHKAKEEQRAKEAEWAKFDELQDWDACILSVDLIKELKTMGLRTASETTFTRYDGVQWMFGNLGGYKHGFGPNKSLPEAEFLRRAKGTIAKRAKEERAKEIVKVPEFGTRVKCDGREWRIASDGPDKGDHYLLAGRDHIGHYTSWRRRRFEFTIID